MLKVQYRPFNHWYRRYFQHADLITNSGLLLLLLLLIHTFSVMSSQLKKLRGNNASAIDLSNANPACGHKEVRGSTGHIVVTTRYSDQQGSKSRQKRYATLHAMAPTNVKTGHQSSLLDIESNLDRFGFLKKNQHCCRLSTTGVLSNKADKLRPNQF